MAKKFTAEELAVLESGVEGQPITRVQALENELKELETDKKILEIEKGLHHLMDEIHPSKREQASKALKTVLGGVKENIKSRHGANVERREKIKKGIGEIVKFLREEKAKKMAGTQSGFTLPAKYYEKALGSGWAGEKESKPHKHHHAKTVHHKKHRRVKYIPMGAYPPRMMIYPKARRSYPWEEY